MFDLIYLMFKFNIPQHGVLHFEHVEFVFIQPSCSYVNMMKQSAGYDVI